MNLSEGERVGVHKFGKDLQELIDFGETMSVQNSLNTTKMYKFEDFAYILLNHQKIERSLNYTKPSFRNFYKLD